MKPNSTMALFDYGVKKWDVLTLYNRGKDRTVVVLVISISSEDNCMTVTTKNVSNYKIIRFVQIKFLKIKNYLYEKYFKHSEQKNSPQQSNGDRSACNNSM